MQVLQNQGAAILQLLRLARRAGCDTDFQERLVGALAHWLPLGRPRVKGQSTFAIGSPLADAVCLRGSWPPTANRSRAGLFLHSVSERWNCRSAGARMAVSILITRRSLGIGSHLAPAAPVRSRVRGAFVVTLCEAARSAWAAADKRQLDERAGNPLAIVAGLGLSLARRLVGYSVLRRDSGVHLQVKLRSAPPSSIQRLLAELFDWSTAADGPPELSVVPAVLVAAQRDLPAFRVLLSVGRRSIAHRG